MGFGCHDTPKLPSIPFAEEMMTHDFADKSADCCVTALVLGEWQRSGYRRLFFLPDAVRHSQTTRVEAQELTAAVYWLVSGSSFVSKCRSAPLRRSRIILIGRSSRKQQSQERYEEQNSGKTWIYAPSQDINRSFGETSSDHICLLLRTCRIRAEKSNRMVWIQVPSRHKTHLPPQCPDARSNGPVCVEFHQGAHSAPRLRRLRS